MESENRRDLNSVLENARAQLEMLTVSSHESVRESSKEQIKPNKENEDKSGHIIDQGSTSSTERASVEEYTKELKALGKNDEESVDEEESSNKNFDSSITSLGDQRSFQNDLTNQNELTSQTTYTNIHDVKNPENDEVLVVTSSKMDDIPLSNENSRGVSQQEQQSFIEDSPSNETTNTTGTTGTVESIKKPDVIPHNQMNEESVGNKPPEAPVVTNKIVEEPKVIDTTRREKKPDVINHKGIISFINYANPFSANEASEDSVVDEFEQNLVEQDMNEQLLNVDKCKLNLGEQDEDENEQLLNVDEFEQILDEQGRNELLLNGCKDGRAIKSSKNMREFEISRDSVMEAACQLSDGAIECSKNRGEFEISKDSVIDEACQIISVFDSPLEPDRFLSGQSLNANQTQYSTDDRQIEFVQNYDEEINRIQNNIDFDEGFVDDGFVDSRDHHPAKIIFVAEQDDEGSNKPFDTEDDISSSIENSDGSPQLHETPSLTNLRIQKEDDSNPKLWNTDFRNAAPPLNLLNTNMTQALVTFTPPPTQPVPLAVPSLPEILENILLLKPSEMISPDDFVSDSSQCFDSTPRYGTTTKNPPKIIAVQPKTSSSHGNTHQTDSDTYSETPITSLTTDDENVTIQTENDDSLPVLNTLDRALLTNVYNRPPTPFENIVPIQSPDMSTTVDNSSDSTKSPPRVPTRVIQKKIKFKFIRKLFGIKNVRSKN